MSGRPPDGFGWDAVAGALASLGIVLLVGWLMRFT